jgi:hypothetical protein
MWGLYFMKNFDIMSEGKAIWIPDHTTQVINENVENVWSQNCPLCHIKLLFTWRRKHSTVTDMKHCLGQVTKEPAYVTSSQSAVI